MGYKMVTGGTSSFGPKLNRFTRATTSLLSRSDDMSVDSIAHAETRPSGSMVRRNTIFPCSLGSFRNSRL